MFRSLEWVSRTSKHFLAILLQILKGDSIILAIETLHETSYLPLIGFDGSIDGTIAILDHRDCLSGINETFVIDYYIKMQLNNYHSWSLFS